jgi:hypothetical protein
MDMWWHWGEKYISQNLLTDSKMDRYMDFKGVEGVQNNFLISIAPFIFISPLSQNKHRISFQAFFPQYIHLFSRVVF